MFTILKERYIFEEKAHNSAQRMKKIWITLRKVKEKTFSNQRRKKPERITHYNMAKIVSKKDERTEWKIDKHGVLVVVVGRSRFEDGLGCISVTC